MPLAKAVKLSHISQRSMAHTALRCMLCLLGRFLPKLGPRESAAPLFSGAVRFAGIAYAGLGATALPDDIEIIDRMPLYQGRFRVDRYRLRHRLFAGGMSRVVEREVFERGHAVAVLPYDPAADTVALVEQLRIGPIAAGGAPWMTEIVAGIIEPGESPEAVARRETAEECGATVAALEPVHTFYPSPGASSETVRLFCARIDSRGLAGVRGLAEEDEDIRVRVVAAADALAMAEGGAVDNAITLIALYWLAANRSRLRAIWR